MELSDCAAFFSRLRLRESPQCCYFCPLNVRSQSTLSLQGERQARQHLHCQCVIAISSSFSSFTCLIISNGSVGDFIFFVCFPLASHAFIALTFIPLHLVDAYIIEANNVETKRRRRQSFPHCNEIRVRLISQLDVICRAKEGDRESGGDLIIFGLLKPFERRVEEQKFPCRCSQKRHESVFFPIWRKRVSSAKQSLKFSGTE